MTKGNLTKKKNLNFEPGEEEVNYEEYFYYNEAFSKSKDDEEQIRCSTVNEECAGCEEEDDEFLCEF